MPVVPFDTRPRRHVAVRAPQPQFLAMAHALMQSEGKLPQSAPQASEAMPPSAGLMNQPAVRLE